MTNSTIEQCVKEARAVMARADFNTLSEDVRTWCHAIELKYGHLYPTRSDT